jgi:hypothetical protein
MQQYLRVAPRSPSQRVLCATITLLLGSSMLTTRAAAQGVQTGTIRGSVVDTDGLPTPGVTVTAASPVIQGRRSTITDATGSYALAALPPGTYEVTYELSGFGTVSQQTTVLLGLTVDQNVTMRPAGVVENLRVVAQTPGPIAVPTSAAISTTTRSMPSPRRATFWASRRSRLA